MKELFKPIIDGLREFREDARTDYAEEIFRLETMSFVLGLILLIGGIASDTIAAVIVGIVLMAMPIVAPMMISTTMLVVYTVLLILCLPFAVIAGIVDYIKERRRKE